MYYLNVTFKYIFLNVIFRLTFPPVITFLLPAQTVPQMIKERNFELTTRNTQLVKQL